METEGGITYYPGYVAGQIRKKNLPPFQSGDYVRMVNRKRYDCGKVYKVNDIWWQPGYPTISGWCTAHWECSLDFNDLSFSFSCGEVRLVLGYKKAQEILKRMRV